MVLPAGAAWTADGLSGACLTLPPGRWRLPLRSQVRHGPAFVPAFGSRFPWAFGLLTRMESRHLREPHWYFPYIGVVPAAQGQGLGRTLMGPTLERCDREGLPAYLEASSPRNAALYRRLGFKDIAELRFAGSPPLGLMRRDPLTRMG